MNIKGGLLAWMGIYGDQDQWLGADIVLASHPCEEVTELQVGNSTFPFVTNIDGDTNYNGVGLILNTGLAVDSHTFPADWWVPVTGGVNGKSQWWRNPRDDGNSDDRAHIGVKFYYGTQTVIEPLHGDAVRDEIQQRRAQVCRSYGDAHHHTR